MARRSQGHAEPVDAWPLMGTGHAL
jgi:hypothetical protein